MDAFKQQMSKSDAEKLKAVSTIAKLIAEQQPIEQRLAASSSTVTSENGKIDGFQQEIKQLATQRNDAEALKQKTVQEFDTKSASLVSMKEELQGLPGMIQTYAKSMTDQQAAISSLQTTLAESITKREASQKTLQSVDQELVSVDSELNSANQKLRALQEELVAFESTSKRLRDEAAKGVLIAQQKRAELDPLQKGVDGGDFDFGSSKANGNRSRRNDADPARAGNARESPTGGQSRTGAGPEETRDETTLRSKKSKQLSRQRKRSSSFSSQLMVRRG